MTNETDVLDAIEWPEDKDDYEPCLDHKAVWNFNYTLPALIMQAMTILKEHPSFPFAVMGNTVLEDEQEVKWRKDCDTIIDGCRYFLDKSNDALFDNDVYEDINARLKQAFDTLAPMLYHCWT